MEKTLPLIRSVPCILRSEGTIMCVPPYNHVVACSANLRRWPYDTHTCTMMIGSWTHKGDEINITVFEPAVRINWVSVHGRTISASTYRNCGKKSGIIFNYIALNTHDVNIVKQNLRLKTDRGSVHQIFIRLIIYKWNYNILPEHMPIHFIELSNT
jgi:Neurotransmitter-gated ion-channel ligand binding domain.